MTEKSEKTTKESKSEAPKDLTAKLENLAEVVDKRRPKILKEFTNFVNRGNVIDLAVGVIIGGAFGKIVSSLVNDIIMPLVGTLIGGIDFTHLEITVPNPIFHDQAAHITYGNFLQNVIDFLIVAFCIFLFVRPINKISEKKKKEEDAKKAQKKKTDEEILSVLKDIRTELKKK